MLWSLFKILVFVAIIGLLALGGHFLMQTSGGVQITVAGTEFTLGPLQSVIALGVLVFAVWLFFKLLSLLVATLKFLNGDETALSRYFDRSREQRGYQALADGLMALASGEGRAAMTKANKAEKLLNKPELTNLLVAQAAEMTGDTKKAADTYKKLVTNNATRFVGVRGIMKQKLAEGDDETARKLAEKALAIKPRHEETQDVLLNLQTKAQDWAGARSTLSSKLKAGYLPRDVFKRRDAVLALSEAKDILDEDASLEQQEHAIEANRLSPDLVPAAAMAARAYIAKGKPRPATKILKKAWEAQPHPDLAHAFAEIAPDETPAQRIKRFTALTRIHPENMETRLILAELNIVAEDFPEARRALGDVVEKQGDARAYTLMAAIERGEGASDAVVQGWLAKALNAPRGPQWVCDNCHDIQPEWAPVCQNCGSFDTLSWQTPQTPKIASATGVHMLPLIVGALEDQSDEPEEVEPLDETDTVDVTAEPAESADEAGVQKQA
ncbi:MULTISPECIES: heme biosynthesis protein HemY [unclassified Ruegeria]|uniref:heme biosynthesis protein HemY n=1 Tax=unclassified Ruegeria TaxID=2625375 RepID=UPI00149164A4|nr:MULTISPECIES: heme biosynthesis HemY N-terminal domain-containing protein [unclassified Ruegeria]NOD33407.1 heme biosynthesis protein HemY [Ruegeria sp. HKCCD7296]NOE41365.1 heme biosynthesis protein HemY [Ruegeria sp. HKCCD7319]